MRVAIPEPIQLARFLEENSSKIRRVCMRAFANYNDQLLGTEDEVCDLFIQTIIPALGWSAKFKGNTHAQNGQKPDIWVFEKGKAPEAFIVIEALKRRATEGDFQARRVRGYDESSKSKLWFVTNGRRVDAYLGNLLICEPLDLVRERDRLLFSSMFNPDNPMLSGSDSASDMVDFDLETEKIISQVIFSHLKTSQDFRIPAVVFITQAFLEHAGYETSTFTEQIAQADIGEVPRIFQRLLRSRTGSKNLARLKTECLDLSFTLERLPTFLKSLSKINGKSVNYRNLNSYTFSRMYESVFSKEERKNHGIYTTPQSACVKIAQQAYKALTSNAPRDSHSMSVGIVDVSCGAGNFCEAMIEVLFQGVDYGNAQNGIERRNERYSFKIIGQDLNAEAVTFAEAATLVAIERRRRSAEYQKNRLKIQLQFSVGDSTSKQTPVYGHEFDNLLFLGNPPYVKQTNQSLAKTSRSEGKKNLGTIMMENMSTSKAKVRKTMGILYQMALVGTQNDGLQATFDEAKLRIVDFIDFGISRMFTGIGAQRWAGIVWSDSKEYTGSLTRVNPVVAGSNLVEIDDLLKEEILKSESEILNDTLKINDSFSFAVCGSHSKELAGALISLRQAKLEVSQGIAANAEFFDKKRCFQVENKTFPAGTLNSTERSFLRKYWTGGWEASCELKWGGEFLIDIPKTVYVTEKGEWDEHRFKQDCPALYRHLKPFKDRLLEARERKTGAIPWWSLHWPRGGRIYATHKVVAPQLINWRYPVQFYIDNGGLGVSFSYNVILPQQNYIANWQEALVGWLNSGIVAFYLAKMQGAKPRGQGGEITIGHLKAIPVPDCIVSKSSGRSSQLVSMLIDVVNRSKVEGQSENIQNAIDAICTDIVICLIEDQVVEDIVYKRDMIAS